MNHLLLIAHGSRRESSNDEIRALAARLQNAAELFSSVSCAFLEIAEPSIPTALQTLITQGKQKILVLPYFLSAGRHVSEDIPLAVAQISEQHPQTEIKIAGYFGSNPQIAALLLAQATAELKEP
jgi:sirohydrochlorin ferrochelatase